MNKDNINKAVTLVPCREVNLIINGKTLPNRFTIESEWEGFMKLKACDGAIKTLIVHKPSKVHPWSFLSLFLGGYQEENKEQNITTEAVSASPDVMILFMEKEGQ